VQAGDPISRRCRNTSSFHRQSVLALSHAGIVDRNKFEEAIQQLLR
jgi:hypothetical protein